MSGLVLGIFGKIEAAAARRPPVRALVRNGVLGGALALAGCAAPSSYMGIDLAGPVERVDAAAGYESMPLPTLAARAQGGDKYAQFELGLHFETGRGVARDLDKAKRLYRAAASDSGGIVYVYNPSPDGRAGGSLLKLDQGPEQAGLAAAMRKLEAMENANASEL